MSFVPTEIGKCPHCTVEVRFERVTIPNLGGYNADVVHIQTPSNRSITLVATGCPACGRPIISIAEKSSLKGGSERVDALVWPDGGERPVPDEVEQKAPELAQDFREAVSVFPKSKKASAALSRRCLQYILTHEAGAKSTVLAQQIDEVLPKLPPALADNVDAVRVVGNMAAHPIKSTNTGEIVEVEDGEAEWTLDVLEDLFEHYYVAPARAAAKRAALNDKLSDAGKPPLKTS